MYFTHCAPGIIASYRTDALQIYSFKIFDLNDNLKWPLYVYGVVADRDAVDCNRNLLFSRSRANCQVVTEKVCMQRCFPSFCMHVILCIILLPLIQIN